MKKYIEVILWLIIFTIVCSQAVKAQGETDSPYDTDGWDLPEEYTGHYGLPVYRLLSNPGGWINWNQFWIDSLFYELVVYTDTSQMIIRNDTLIHSPLSNGQAWFSSTDTSVTVSVPGLDTADVIQVTAITYGGVENLSVVIGNDTFDVRRAVGGRSGLKFNWSWKRRY